MYVTYEFIYLHRKAKWPYIFLQGIYDPTNFKEAM